MSVVKICLTQHCKYIPGCNSPPNCTTNGREPYPENPLFERVSYKVTNRAGSAYWICYFTQIKGKKLEMRHFQLSERLDRIDGYYSIQDPNKMLLVALKFAGNHRGGKTFYYTFSQLKGVSIGTNKEISSPTLSLEPGEDPGDKVKSNIQVTEKLTSENKRVNSDISKKITLDKESTIMTNIKEIDGQVSDSGFYKLTFIANIVTCKEESEAGFYKIPIDTVFEDGAGGSKKTIDLETLNRFNLIYKQYDLITVYYSNYDHVLLVELVNDESKIHIRRVSLKGKGQWEKESRPFEYTTNDQLANVLEVIQYSVNNNIIVLLDRQTDYQRSEISSITSSPPKDAQPATISVARHPISDTLYLYYKHEISFHTGDALFGIDEAAKKLLTIELDLYIGNVKITLKDGKDTIVQHVYYSEGSNNWLYVYFYGKDPRPLLFFYNMQAYRPNKLDDYTSKWVRVDNLSMTEGLNSNFWLEYLLQGIARSIILPFNLLITLNSVCDFLNPVKIDQRVTMSNVKHGKIKTISLWTGITPTTTNNNCYTKFTRTVNPGFRLGFITHKDKPIQHKGTKEEISAGDFDEVTVFYKTEDESLQYPLLITLKKVNAVTYQSCYKLASTTEKVYNKYRMTTTSDEDIVQILDHINFSILSELGVILTNQEPYSPKLSPSVTESQPDSRDNSQLGVSKYDCPSLLLSSFKCYKHELTKYSKIAEVGRLKFELWNKDLQPLDIEEERVTFTYTKCKGDVYVFFHDSDPRPLLLCYNKNTYKPESKDQYEKKWVKVDSLSKFDCPSNCTNNELLLPILKSVCNFLNPVKIDENTRDHSTSCEYVVHQYNGDKQIKIRLQKEDISSCYTKLTHRPNSGHRLGNIMYQNVCVKVRDTEEEIIAGDYSEGIVIYKKEDTSFKYPLLIALKTNSTYRPYYELTSNTQKVYKKVDGPITLDEKHLVQTLDLINYNVLKKLNIVLQNQQDYNPDLIGTCDRPPPEPPPFPSSHTLEVSKGKYSLPVDSSYTCYTHKLTKFNDVNDIGGLKLAIYKGNELKILDSEGQQVRVTYTKCKGDLYVYFYLNSNSSNTGSTTSGSSSTPDKVPLMFSFDSKWYSPQSNDEYFKQWNEVQQLRGVPSTHYTTYASMIRKELDRVNKLLNEVDISETSNYGISWGCSKPSGFNPDRIKVQHENIAKLFKKYTHSTINTFQFGNVTFTHKHNFHGSSTTLFGIEASGYDKYSPNSVRVFFVNLDSQMMYPLLIAVGKGGKYDLYYELETIKESDKYTYRKFDRQINPDDNDSMEQRLKSILSKLSEEDQGTIYKYLNFQDHEKYHKDLEELKDKLSSNLMKTIIPVGGTYLVAGASLYPATAMLNAFMALV